MDEPDSDSISLQPNGIDASHVDEGDRSESSDTDDSVAIVNINRLAISADGQWLATSDTRARSHVFNLDSISVCLHLSSRIHDSLIPRTVPHNITYFLHTRSMPHL